MRSKILLFCLFFSLVMSGCTSTLVIELEPEFKSRADAHKLTKFPVKGLLSNDTIEFGKYKFINTKGVVVNKRSLIVFGFGSSIYEKHFSFQYPNGSKLWNVLCEDFISSDYELGGIRILEQYYKCKMTVEGSSNETEETPAISFEFAATFEGNIQVDDAGMTVVISTDFEDEEDPDLDEDSESFFQMLANSRYRDGLSGYLFMKEGKVIGALQSFRDPTVWIDQRISPELQESIALVSASYFVRAYLRGEDHQFDKRENDRF